MNKNGSSKSSAQDSIVKKGGLNPEPTTQKPNFNPPPQKPTQKKSN